MRILVVDDDFISRTQIKSLLSVYGDCDVAPSAEVSLLMIKDSLENQIPYDLVTMDVDMPNIKGQEAVHMIREMETALGIAGDAQMKIVMVTVKNKVKDVSAAYQENCSAYIVKPATAQNIKEVLATIGIVTP
jgi:two-component system chemotaxis response regulator CheY